MGKVVVLKLDGDFEQGFRVTLEIGEDGKLRSVPATGKLPPIPEISQIYESWQYAFRSLGSRFRLEWEEEEEETDDSVVRFSPGVNSSCKNFNDQLKESINDWLDSKDFRPIKNKLLLQLNSSDKVRVIIQTDEKRLWQLPWGIWNFFDDFPNAGVALSTIEHIPVKYSVSKAPTDKIRILAILGNHTGINVEADRKELNKLVDADIEFLDEPERSDFEALWDKSWDILYFAGHSKTEGEEGIINFNKNESLRLGELKDTLRRAIQNGLKLAIFNSCQGLGLAYELASLHIPQVIVMREPVPDRVAQEFLKYFLKAFSNGRPLYTSVRDAQAKLRELQRLEERFPGASWLPVICQNLAEVPLTWQQLRGIKSELEIDNVSKGKEKSPLAEGREFLPSGSELLDRKFFDAQGQRGESRILKLREATWSLIIQGNYIERDQQYEALAIAQQLAEFPGISLLLLRGEPGAGKTALMRWLVYELFRQGDLILQKRTQKEDLDWLEHLREFSEQIGEQHFYVITDDIFRNDSILEELEQNDFQFPFTLIGTTRLNEDQHNSLEGLGYEIEVLNVNPPSQAEKERILAKVCEDPTVPPKLNTIAAAERQQLMTAPAMLVLMLQLSEGKTFDQTIADIIKNLPSTQQRPIYQVFGVICSFFQYGIAVPPEVVPLCLSQYPLEAIQDVVDCSETAELAGLVNTISKKGYEGLATIHELIAKTTMEQNYKPRSNNNPPYPRRSLERYLTKAIQALDLTQESQRRWAYDVLNRLGVSGESDLIRQVFINYSSQIQSLQDGSGFSEWFTWLKTYEALGLIDEKNRCQRVILSTEPQSVHERGHWLSLIENFGTNRQRQEAITQTVTWLQQHLDDSLVRIKYLTLVEKQGTLEQKRMVISETANWLQEHPEDYKVRINYLRLVEKQGTLEQKQTVISQTATWLQEHPEEQEVRTRYLTLIEKQGTLEQKHALIAQTAAWLQNHPEDFLVRIKYLNLVEKQGTVEQRQTAIAQTTHWLQEHPKIYAVRTKYLVLVEKYGTSQQKQATIAQTANWLEEHSDKIETYVVYLTLIEKQGTPEQKHRAIFQTATWLQKHPEDQNVRIKYLTLVEKQGTPQQQQAAIAQTATWLQEHGKTQKDQKARQKYLVLVEKYGSPQQKQTAIVETSAWLQEHPEDDQTYLTYLMLIEKQGTPEQKHRAIFQTATWLQEHPEDQNVRIRYLTLLEKQGTPQQNREAVTQTVTWLQTHPNDRDVRTKYLGLVEKQGSTQQKREAITQTAGWLQGHLHLEDVLVRPRYLKLVENQGTSEQKQEAIIETFAWLEAHPRDCTVRQLYLMLVQRYGTLEQKRKAITQTATWLQTNPNDLTVRRKYLVLIEQGGTLEQRQEAIAQTSAWLETHPNDSQAYRECLAHIKQLKNKRPLKLHDQFSSPPKETARTVFKQGLVKFIKYHVEDYRYGFITPDDGSADIFFREGFIPPDCLSKLREGTLVEVEVKQTPKGLGAKSIRIIAQFKPM